MQFSCLPVAHADTAATCRLCRLEYCLLTGAGPQSASSARRVRVSSQQGLELSITEVAVDAAALLAAGLQQAAAAAAHPAGWEQHCQVVGSSSAYSANFSLDNQTGSTVHVWLVRGEDTSAAQAPAPEGPPDLEAAPGQRVPLPAPPHSAGAAFRSQHAGEPSVQEGVTSGSSTSSSSGSHPWDSTHQQPSALLERLSRPRFRTLLYFRLSEQGQLCGPIHLDRCAHPAPPRRPAAPRPALAGAWLLSAVRGCCLATPAS